MAKNNNLTDFLTDVANAIRAKTGETEAINPQDFSTKIANITGDNSKLLSIIDRSVTEVTAEDLKGLTSIGNNAFYECVNLTSAEIPNSVTSIGSEVFEYCSSLTSITIKATNPPTMVIATAFNNSNNCPIYVPAESVEAYKTATNWVKYADRIFAIQE